jgi:GT2 family glycosyltransferase
LPVPRISVTIPTYDGRDLLDVVLPSVVAQEVDGELEIVVVDDGSTDGTAQHLAESWPQVRIVVQPNAGVSAAMNRCLAEASGDYVALLNNDLELAPGFLEALASELDAHPEAGSACGKMLDYAQRDVIDGAGDVMRWSGACWRRGHGERDRGQFDAPEAVLSPCGGAAMYRRRTIDDVGSFDDDFVAYLEDVDWGMRAQLRGWSCRYVPAARCFHMGSATTDRPALSRRHALLLRRNGLLLTLKTFPASALVLHLPRIVLFNAGWCVGSVRVGLGSTHLAAWRNALAMLPATLRKRRAIQRRRTVSRRELGDAVTTD